MNAKLMKIAINIELTDQTGKGNKDIVRAYGPGAFEFSGSFLTVRIPYHPLAMDGNEGTGERDVPVNVPVNADALSESETAVLSALAMNPNLVRERLAEMLGKSVKTVARTLDSLKKKGRIIRVGSGKNGHWELTGGSGSVSVLISLPADSCLNVSSFSL